ncbi:hypothetical protein L218DRAFT_997750 [Marasmius fiardii PR-910]|nr:hypothetical protein L218DRAFT_997750 [Marasmius fiardii PR-910]
MALSTSNNYTSIQLLPDDQKFNGEELCVVQSGHPSHWSTQRAQPLLGGLTATAVNNPRPNILEFKICESVVYLTLWNNIKNPDGLGIPHGLMSKDLWKYLEDKFEQMSEISRQRKEDSLRACRYNEGMKIAGEGGYNWVTYGGKVNECIVSQLDEYYLYMGGGGSQSSSSVPAPDKISALQAKIEQLEVALAANNSPKGPRDPSLVCTNPNCKGKGHLIESCWKLGGGKQGQYLKWWKGKRDTLILNQSANFTTTQEFSLSSIITGLHHALTAIAMQALISVVKPNTPIPTYADSGASVHFFRECSMFKTYTAHSGMVGNLSKEGVCFDIIR